MDTDEYNSMEDYEESESDDEEELTEGMADIHPNLVKQQKKYEGKVVFFLEGDEKGAGAKPKAKPPTSAQAKSQASSSGNTKLKAGTGTGLQRQKSSGGMKGSEGSATTTTGQRQQLSAPSRRDVTGQRTRRNGNKEAASKTLSTIHKQQSSVTRTAGKETTAKIKAYNGSKTAIGREGLAQKSQLMKQRSLSNQRQQLGARGGIAGKSTTSVNRSLSAQRATQSRIISRDTTAKSSSESKSDSDSVKKPVQKPQRLIKQTSLKNEDETKKDAAVKKSAVKVPPAPLSDVSPGSSESEQSQKKSESSDCEPSPVKLYQPKPTLKELAEAKTPTKQPKRKHGTVENDSANGYQTFNFGKTPEIIMSVFEQREKEFLQNFSFSKGVQLSPNIDEKVTSEPLPSIDDNKIGTVVSHARPTVGFNNLGNLVHLMDHLAMLKVENKALKRKCSYLEDARSLLNLQNQMISTTRVKQMNKSESFISKAQSKVKHYLANPVHPPFNRVHSDSGSFHPDLLDTPKNKHNKGNLQRSSSVGSIEELDRVNAIVASQLRSHSPEKPTTPTSKTGTAKKKINKKFKWNKVKKVFSKTESPVKSEGGAISAEEIIRVNKQKSMKPRPPSLHSSKSVDHGELGGSISDDNIPSTISYLAVEPPRSSPPSPSSIQSEPGTAFPATTPNEHDYEELNSTPIMTYVDIGGTHSVRTTVRPISQSDKSYSNQAYDDRCSLSDNETEKSRFFDIGGPLVRRKSSPTLSLQGSGELGSFGLNAPIEMRRSSSFKTTRSRRSHMDDSRSITSTAYITENLLSPEDAKRAQQQMRSRDGDVHKKAKAAWFKVKDMIHTRRDSVKKSRRHSVSGEDIEISPEGSSWEDRMPFHMDDYYEEMMMNEYDPLVRDSSSPPGIVRSQTVKPISSSPKPIRKRAASVKSPSEFTHGSPVSLSKRDSVTVMTATGSPIDITSLMGGINEDFHKKMAEWEDKKKKGISGKGPGDLEKGVNFTEDFIRRMEQWERMKGLEGNVNQKPKETQVQKVQKTQSPPPVAAANVEPPNLASGETVEHLSETFSKTVQEWERIKEKRAKEPDSSAVASKGRSRRQERSKSREREKHPRDKSRQRYEKEIQKREQKLEKERQKLERMKQKLDHPAEWHSEGPDILSKFYDWELLKTFNSALSMGEQHHTRSRSEKRQRETGGRMPSRERVLSDSLLDQLLPQDMDSTVGSVEQNSEALTESFSRNVDSPPQPTSPLVDDSTSIDLGLTMETIAMLENANEKLSIALSERDEEIVNMQDESRDLANQLQRLTDQHNTDIEQYRKELWASSKIGHYSIESQNLTSSLKQLKQKLNELQEYGEKVMSERKNASAEELSEKEQLSIREQELLDQIATIQRQLDCKAYVQGTEVFDTLYKHILNIHKQVHNLQCGVLERDQMINTLQRHVMIQEVYNNLLNSELQRREAAVNFLKQQRKAGILRRWNTFHGQDITIRQDGTIELKKDNKDETYHVVPSSVKKLKQETGDLVKDRSEALALHFQWLESMKEQIKDIQKSQTAEKGAQISTEKCEIDTQTLLSLLNPSIPLRRLQWDGSVIDVCDQSVQHHVTTADAAVFIEDIDVYERKQKVKRKLGGLRPDKTIPQKGTVSKRMEMFDPKLKDKTPEQICKQLSSKSTESMEEEQCKNKTVIGKKVLDYEQCEHIDLEDDDLEQRELSPTTREKLLFNSESIEPVSVVYQESAPARGSTSSFGTDVSESPALQRFSITSSDIEVSFTLTLPYSDDENAKDLKNEKDFTKRSSYSEDDLLQFVEGDFHDLPPEEIVFTCKGNSNSESDVHKTTSQKVTGSTSCDVILESRPPLSPIIRSKYARRQKAEMKQSTDTRQSNIYTTPRRGLRHMSSQSSTEKFSLTENEDNSERTGRTCSDSSTLHSKYGSGDIEETTAAKFSVNMERYFIKPRAFDGIPVQEKTLRSFEAQPFSRDCLFRKSPSPALRKPAVSALHTLKTAEELLKDTQVRTRSLSVPREGTFGIFPVKNRSGKTSGEATPHSLPGTSPRLSRKEQAELLKIVTKRLSLPSGQLSPDIAGQGQSSDLAGQGQVEGKIDNRKTNVLRQSKRKALVLEPVVIDKNKQLRPHSVISYISEGSESQTSESIWQKLVKSKSSSLQHGAPAGTSSKNRSPGGKPFKLFTRKFHHHHRHHSPNKHGAISKLCMQTVTLDTSESEGSSIQCLPDDEEQGDFTHGSEVPITAETSFQVTSSSPLTGKKQKKKPFLDAKWLARSKRFFKGSNFSQDGKSESESQSEADENRSQSPSICDSKNSSNNSSIRKHDNKTTNKRGHIKEQQHDPDDSNKGDEPLLDNTSSYSNSQDFIYASNNPSDIDSFHSSRDGLDNMDSLPVDSVGGEGSSGNVNSNNPSGSGIDMVVSGESNSEGNLHKIPIIQIHNEM